MQRNMLVSSVILSLMLLFYAVSAIWMLLDIKFKKLNKKKQGAVLLFSVVIVALHIFVIARYGTVMYARYYPLIAQIPVLIAFCFISEHSGAKVLFAVLTGVLLSAPIVFFSGLAQTILGATAAQVALLRLAGYVLMLIAVKKFFCPPVHYMMHNCDKGWLQFCLIPTIYYLTTYFSGKYDFSGQKQTDAMLISGGLLLLVGAAYFLILKFFRQTYEKMELKKQQDVLKIQTAAAQTNIEQLEQEQEKMRYFQHDVRHHAQMLRAFLQSGEIEQAQSYLDTIEQERESIMLQSYCRNNAVNLILSSFATKAKQQNVIFSTDIKIGEHGDILDCDLCVVLSNALENAVRCAAENAAREKRVVSVEMYCKNKKMCIKIQNPFEGSVTIANGIPQTNQKNHGTGARRIVAICEKYSGIYRFEMQNGIFCTSVVL